MFGEHPSVLEMRAMGLKKKERAHKVCLKKCEMPSYNWKIRGPSMCFDLNNRAVKCLLVSFVSELLQSVWSISISLWSRR